MLVVVLQVQVQEVYTHMVQQSKVITISGRPGIGKTEVGDSIRSIGSLVELLRIGSVVCRSLATYVSRTSKPVFARNSFGVPSAFDMRRRQHFLLIDLAFFQVARQACEYAKERCLFEETFFVSLQDKKTGAPITSLKKVAARIASVVGISKQVCVYGARDFAGRGCGFVARSTDTTRSAPLLYMGTNMYLFVRSRPTWYKQW